jgi:HEAT repeat protein
VDATLTGLLRLLEGKDVEARCAVLLVLTQLGAGDPKVARAVRKAIESPNVVVRDFALGYFEAVRPPGGIEAVLPLLDSEDDALRERAVAILSAYGAPAAAAVKPLLGNGPRRRLHAVIALLARVHSSAALDLLFRLIEDDDLDVSRSACDAVLGMLSEAGARLQQDLFDRAQKLAAVKKPGRSALVGAAKIFGALGRAEARRPLFAMLAAADQPAVRTHALAALQSCLRDQKLTPAEIERLLPLLESDDEAGVLRPIVRLLENQTIDRRHLSFLQRLGEAAAPLVKRFVVQKLGEFDSTAIVQTLIGYLSDDSYARRDQAAVSLKALPAARAALMKEFLACDDERRAWTIEEVLLAHGASWKRTVVDALSAKLEAAVEKRDDRLYAPYFHLLQTLDAGVLAERVRARAERQHKLKHFALAARWLGLLKDSAAWDAEAQFAFAIATLKAHPVFLSSITPRQQAALGLLGGLAGEGFPLAERIRRERALTPDDIYFIAFHLAEERGEKREAARQLLEHLTAKHGRTKVGKAARNKLKLVAA